MKFFYWLRGWVIVRPIRWAFGNMSLASWSSKPRWKSEPLGWTSKRKAKPNWHWWYLDKTVGRFFYWLSKDAWRRLCKWNTVRETFPWYARAIKYIGDTTAGYSWAPYQCFHCAHPDGSQVTLADDETGTTFQLLETGTQATQEGTDHWFRGITICPKCGYRSEYSDGSL